MLSRRSVLAALGAAVWPEASTAAAGATASLTLEPATGLHLVPPFPTGDALRISGADSELHLPVGVPTAVDLRNGLDAPETLRWDGVRGGGALDAPETSRLSGLAPGATRTVPMLCRDAGTTLLRAAPSAAHHAARGLQAVVVAQEGAPPDLDGDVTFLFADRLFTAEGAPRFGTVPPADTAATVFTVNGRPAPWEGDVPPRSRLRLRLVNGSVRRVMLVSLDGARPAIVAIDGQPSDLFAPARGTVPVGPGARYDLIVDMPETSGAEVRLTLRASERLGAALEGERTLVRLRATGTPRPPRPRVAALPPNPALPSAIPLEAAKRVDLVVAGTPGTPAAAPHGWTVNQVAGDAAAAPVLSVRSGETVTLGLVNTTAMLVPLRLSGHPVRLLHAKDDGWDPYWRDTLLLPPGSRNHVAFVADAAGRWAIDSGFDDLTLAGLFCFYEVRPG